MKHIRARRGLAVVLAALGLAACAEPGSPPPEASLEGGVAATTEVPESLTGDYEYDRYIDDDPR